MRNENKKHIRGAGSILLITLISAVIMLIALGSASLMNRQIKTSREIGNSITAYYAADAGAEKCVFEYMKGNICNISSTSLDNGATYSVNQTGSKVDSIGVYQGTNRAVELTW